MASSSSNTTTLRKRYPLPEPVPCMTPPKKRPIHHQNHFLIQKTPMATNTTPTTTETISTNTDPTHADEMGNRIVRYQ